MKMMFGLETWLDFKWDVEGESGIPSERKKGGGGKLQQEAGAKCDTWDMDALYKNLDIKIDFLIFTKLISF